MSMADLGSLGEFIGAIAVVATLLYLAVQIKQQTIATKAQINQARSDSFQQLLVALITSPSMTQFLEKWDPRDESKLDALTSLERVQLRHILMIQRDRCDNMFYQFQLGFLDREYYESQVRANIELFGPSWSKLLHRNGRPSFMDEVDRVLEAAEKEPSS